MKKVEIWFQGRDAKTVGEDLLEPLNCTLPALRYLVRALAVTGLQAKSQRPRLAKISTKTLSDDRRADTGQKSLPTVNKASPSALTM